MKQVLIYLTLFCVVSIFAQGEQESGGAQAAGVCYLFGFESDMYHISGKWGIIDLDFDFEDYVVNIKGTFQSAEKGTYRLALQEVIFIAKRLLTLVRWEIFVVLAPQN